MKTLLTIAGVFVAFTILSFSCEEDNNAAEADQIRQQMEALKSEIVSIVKTQCNDTPSCSTLGLGMKPCGGNSEYLIYSTSSTNVSLLSAKVGEYNELSGKYNQMTNAVSDCMMVMPPTIECLTGDCKVAQPQ